MAENTGENLKPSPQAPIEAKNPSIAREDGSLTPQQLERIYDLKQTDRLLKSVGSGLPEVQKRELETSISSRLGEMVGWNLDPASLNPSDKKQVSEFLGKWDRETPEARNRRVLTALELLEAKKIDPKTLEQKRQNLVNEVTEVRNTQKHQKVKDLSDREIRQWDELRSKQGLNREEQIRLNDLRQRASQELAKALDALGMRKGILPLLVNPEVRKDFERLLTDEKAMKKIEALKLRLQIGKSPDQPKESPVPFTHQKLQELLSKMTTDIKKALQNSGDYRLWVLPLNGVKYAEEHIIPTITTSNNDLDGTLRLIQSIIDIRQQFAYSGDIPRVGALRVLAGILPKEDKVSQSSGLSETELSQRKTEASKQLDELDVAFKRSGDQRLWMLPQQACDTVKILLEEIAIGGAKQSAEMIQDRLNSIDGIVKHYKEIYSRK